MTAQPIVVKKLTEQQLPIFAHSARAYKKAINEEVPDWQKIGDIILKDPGLALRILEEINSGSKRSKREVSEMSQAAMLLGDKRCKNLIKGLPIVEESLDDFSRDGYTKAVSRAFHAAYQAWRWAQIKGDYAPDEVLLATLLRAAPEFVLWISEPRKMHRVRRKIYKDRMSPDEAQYICLGESLQHFGRITTADIALPSLVQDSLRPENTRIPRVHSVMLAAKLADTVEFGWYSSEVEKIIKLIAENLSKSIDQTTRMVHQEAVNAARESPYKTVRPAAALLPFVCNDADYLIAKEFPDEVKEENTQPDQEETTTQTNGAKPERGKLGATPPILSTVDSVEKKIVPDIQVDVTAEGNAVQPVEVETNPSHNVCFSPQLGLFTAAMKELEAGMGKMKTNDIIRLAVHGIHDGVGMHRVVFAAPVKNNYLEANFLVGTDNDPGFNHFRIKLDGLNLFSRLLAKPNGLWINDENRNKYWSLVPSEFKVLIKVNCFCVLSVHVDSKPAGMFYADRYSPDCKIDQQSYTLFRRIGVLTAKCLAASPKEI